MLKHSHSGQRLFRVPTASPSTNGETQTPAAPVTIPLKLLPRRVRAEGKFLFSGGEKLWVRGVTYGTFRPDHQGSQFPSPDVVATDFARIATNGLNAVRTYMVPPRWLLDAAVRSGLRVMVGLPWEQHVTFLDDRHTARSIERRVRAGIRTCAGHPAVLCYAVGNEIPAGIVRWYGRKRIERHIERLHRAAKDEDPDGLVTYVNYPTTEYLELPFLDLACFNVYLESQERFEAYLARLHNLTGDRPLLLGELGLDSRRHGDEQQARVLEWQIRTLFGAGCSGGFVFSWTDEWYRGGYDIQDWDFGLTRRDRSPKPALAAVRGAFADVPFTKDQTWPRVSVVVCSYNGARTIRDCLEGLVRLEYPDFEVIVVDDGSTDATAAIVREYGFRLITTENRGLSSARNTGLAATSGDIVAYTDDDARPDPHWLTYLAATFMTSAHAGVGGPNVASATDGPVADCVAHAPGGPMQVLVSDRVAEHIPGCNMAFRKTALEAIGGFDPQFRVAGDDVDVCWRLQQRGWTLGFNPGAMVVHHRRNSVHAYWKQQFGYGKAEALLERKWPERYNAVGHHVWAGQLYGPVGPVRFGGKGRIYHGVWGNAPFQSLYQPVPGTFSSLLLMPEWYLVLAILAGLSILGLWWTPLLYVLPILGLAGGATLIRAVGYAAGGSFATASRSRLARMKRKALTALLTGLQPLARLRGRLSGGLTLWRRRGVRRRAWPGPSIATYWSEHWRLPADILQRLEATLRVGGAAVFRGGDCDRWDLEVRGGGLGAARLLMAVEEHGGGKQLVRLRWWPRCSGGWLALIGLLAGLATVAMLDAAWMAGVTFGTVASGLGVRAALDCSAAAGAIRGALPALTAPSVERGERS